jgi:electron transfer flavoprotein alpha subunit
VKIVVLVKQVPSPQAIRLDPETKQLVREGVPLELNEFDVYAVAEAVRLRGELGGEVVVLTMGPPQAEETLRLTLLMGADRAIHLNDRVFAVADTLGTSRTLAMAVTKEGADLVICGRKTVDSETWQVPPETAAFLGWPHVTSVDRIEPLGDGRVRARRETDEGFDTYEVELPGLYDHRFGQTGSPTRVLAVRDVTPERAGEVVGTGAKAAERALALLAAAGPAPRAPCEKPERLGEKPGKSYDCWTVVELVDGRPRRVSLELLGKGRELAGKLGGANCALLLGDGLGEAAREAARHGAERVYLVEDPRLAEYDPGLYAAALRHVVGSQLPHVLLIPSTSSGRDYGPRVAGELELGMTGDCVDLGIDKAGRLIQFKPAYGGNIVSVIMGATTPQLATVRPGMLAPVEPRDDVEAVEIRLDGIELPASRTRLVEREHSPDTAGYELDAAEIVLAVGKGIGGPEALPEVEALAQRIGAVVGATRNVTDDGWLPKNRQVGLTGRAVAPRLYIAVGARGAFEHVVGSTKAGTIVALNKNERAPIFKAADVGVVGDWRETLPALIEGLAGRL